jgi:hypothetical protein
MPIFANPFGQGGIGACPAPINEPRRSYSTVPEKIEQSYRIFRADRLWDCLDVPRRRSRAIRMCPSIAPVPPPTNPPRCHVL